MTDENKVIEHLICSEVEFFQFDLLPQEIKQESDSEEKVEDPVTLEIQHELKRTKSRSNRICRICLKQEKGRKFLNLFDNNHQLAANLFFLSEISVSQN